MKNFRNHVLLFVNAIVLILTSCNDGILGIKGDGPIVEQEIELSELKGVNLSITGNVYLTQSDDQEIVIKAQQNIIDNIETHIHNGVVDFEFDRNVKDHDGIDIYMSINTLSHAGLSGSGNISTLTHFTTDEILTLDLSGSGNFNIDADAMEVYSNMSGSGNFTINTNTDYLQCGISGSGDYTLSGFANKADYNISGSGNYAAFDLESNKIDVNISGSGNMNVFATDELTIRISGSGNIYYKGNPEIDQDISGSGHIRSSN